MDPEIVNVLGERVALEQTSFSPAEKFLVNFSEKYKFPEMTAAEELLVKKLFRMHFSESEKPLPPCTQKEKDLLLKSIGHRFRLLRNELIAERKSQSDSLRLRQILDHVQRLKDYIDFASSVKDCKDLGEDILGEALAELSEDQILELLRQFVFFILQGQHPLEEFVGRDPNPKGFIARLNGNPIPNFQEFLEKYREKKYPVPQAIEQVLEATKIDLDAMKKGIEAALAEKIKGIIGLIRETIPPDDTFWVNPLWDSQTPDIVAIVDALLEKLKYGMEEITECKEKIQQLTQDIMGLTEAQEILLDDAQTNQTRIQMLQAELARVRSESLNPADRAQLENTLQARITELQNQIDSAETERRRLASLIQEKDNQLRAQQQLANEKDAQIQRLTGSQAELERLRASYTALEERLRAAEERARGCDELQIRVRTLEGQIASQEGLLAQFRESAGELTQVIHTHIQEKARLQSRITGLEETAGLYNELLEDLEVFSEALKSGSKTLIETLNKLQRKREAMRKENDPILAKLLAVKEAAQESNGKDPTLATQVADILQDVQAELDAVNAEIKGLQGQVQEQDAQIQSAKARMEEGNHILSLVRAGREDLNAKGFKFETDNDTLEAAFKAVEAEKALGEKKKELEDAVEALTAQNQSLQADMEALTARLTDEIDGLKAELQDTSDKLQTEQQTTAGLRGDIAGKEEAIQSLQESLTAEQEKAAAAEAALEAERADCLQKLAELEERKLRECEEKLNALRAEETKKREALLSAQGGEKGELEARITELLRQITTTEGEREAAKGEVVAVREQLKATQEQLARVKEEAQTKLTDLESRLRAAQEEGQEAKARAVKSAGQVATLEGEVESLKAQIVADSSERRDIFNLVGKVSEWITSGAKLPKPEMSETLRNKYKFDRILNAFEPFIPSEGEAEEGGHLDPLSVSMSRCQLVFFMTYVYARNFPKKTDGDSSYQLRITAFLKTVQANLYSVLNLEIPGKLEPVGAGGIPIQLKSKYMVNLLLPLLRQMEIVHESGKKGAEFLKFSVLEQDQLETLHKLHKLLKDALLQPQNKDIPDILKHYVIRKTGNVDDDIHELFLRFYHETKSNREFPVVMYTKPDAPSVPKFTFGTEEDFEKFLSSPSQKFETGLKLVTPAEKSLVSKPIFSFNILFYLFLFFVRDYLSSIEGELDKAGCPLPLALKPQ